LIVLGPDGCPVIHPYSVMVIQPSRHRDFFLGGMHPPSLIIDAYVYRPIQGGPKSEPLPNDQKVVLHTA